MDAPTSAAALAAPRHARAVLWMPHRGLFWLFGALLAFGAPAGLFFGAWRAHVRCDRDADACVFVDSTGARYTWYVREVNGLYVEQRPDEYALIYDVNKGDDRYMAGGPDRAPLDAAAAELRAYLADPAARRVDVSAAHPAEKWIALAAALVGFVLLACGFRRTVFDVDPIARVLTVTKRTWPLVHPDVVDRRPVADVTGLRFTSNTDGADKFALVTTSAGAVHVHTGLEWKDAQRVADVLGVAITTPDDA